MYIVYIFRQLPEKRKGGKGGNQTKERVNSVDRANKGLAEKRRDKPQEVVVVKRSGGSCWFCSELK